MDVGKLRSFSCNVMSKPPVKKLSTSRSRLAKGFCLGHDGGGVYKIWTDSHTVRTNQVHFREADFPELEINDRIESFSELDDVDCINLLVSNKSIDGENNRDVTLDDAHDVPVSDEVHNIEID